MLQTHLKTAAEFLRQLRKQATKCGYGVSLNDRLREQLVVGVFRENIRQKTIS